MTPKVTMTLNLPAKVPGKYIMEAVQQAAGRHYRQTVRRVVDDSVFYCIGRHSPKSHEEVAIAVGDDLTDTAVSKDGEYQQLAVISYSWPGEKIPFIFVDDDVVENVRHFRDRLEQILSYWKDPEEAEKKYHLGGRA